MLYRRDRSASGRLQPSVQCFADPEYRAPGLPDPQYFRLKLPRNDLKAQKEELSTDDFDKILEEAAALGCLIVRFTGGEPLLFLDELSILIKHAGAAGIPYIRTGTNGFTFVNPHGSHFQKRVARVAETLAATPLRNFWISIDSAVPSVHEKMRGFPEVIEGIEKG